MFNEINFKTFKACQSVFGKLKQKYFNYYRLLVSFTVNIFNKKKPQRKLLRCLSIIIIVYLKISHYNSITIPFIKKFTFKCVIVSFTLYFNRITINIEQTFDVEYMDFNNN